MRFVPLILLAALSLAGDALCRLARPGVDEERLFKSAATAFSRLPETIGPWHAVPADDLLDADAIRMLQCRAHESRVYTDDQSGERVSLILLAGPPGPLVAHTPEVCYSSYDSEVLDSAHPVTLRDSGPSADVFAEVTFQSRALAGQKQRVYYGWRKPAGPWQAPNNPRLALTGSPMLYKLQLASDIAPALPAGDKDKKPADPARRFLTDLLPILDKTLE